MEMTSSFLALKSSQVTMLFFLICTKGFLIDSLYNGMMAFHCGLKLYSAAL